MTGVGDDSRGRLAGRPWLVVGLVLAVGATLALVLSDDLRYLRLGIVAALWAALIGAFLAVRYRKHVSQSEEAVAEAQAVYELELEREIAARREFELEMEAETRQAAESRSHDELEALRAEVSALRESLQSLFGGEVLLERVALTAQATRMRSLDNKQLMSAGSDNGNGKPQLMAANGTTIDVDDRERGRDRPTEMIDRVLEPVSARAGASPAARRKPSNGQVNGHNGVNNGGHKVGGYGQSNQVPRPKPVDESTRRSMRKADARASKAAEALAAEAARRERLEMSNPGMSPAEVSRPMPRVDAKRKTPPPVSPAEESRPSMPDVSRAEVSQPSMPAIARQPQRPEPQRQEAQRPEPQRRPQQPSLQQRLDAGNVQRPPAPRPEEQTRKQTPPVKPPAQAKPVKKVEPDRPRPNRELGLTRPGMKPVERPRPAGGTPPPVNKPAAEPEPMEATGEWKPSWTQERPVSELGAAFPRKDDFQDRLRPTPPSKPQPSASPPRPQATTTPPPRPEPRPEPPSPVGSEPPPRRTEPVRPPEPEPVRPAAAETPSRHGGGSEEPPAVNPTLPEEVRAMQSRPGGRRRRAAEDSSASLTPAPNVAEPTGGGRRRRPDGEPPAWQSAAAETGGRHGGKRAKPDDEAPSRNGSSHSRPEPETPAAGSHASGRSVMDLLAANGANESTPRRRRRAED
ncbi:DUF6779 domain-containing protein [Amycolatopsis regifaucium]|uniref:DUF6779 domain-containing protein n=1 Tax=Amycolatopsis regifaucium TaxID=546365 RepID=A0A154MFX4_9PSEU|nr:DUF6779 domain-containing protein [Amycolatopsis regifaucium]KZB83345.1 hypothetical protein AVL48_04140 [Amycolatopsis regifaucium]OKA08811.1 hypothetical protein ATP06_0210605 [Amycolatopsis regifaucium]